MAVKSANLYARIEPEVKEQAESKAFWQPWEFRRLMQ